METEIVKLNMGEIRIVFLNPQGEPLKPGDEARACYFVVEGPGIDSKRVKRVELPTLDYGNPEPLTVKVEMYTSLSFATPGTEHLRSK